jgi:molecular chaperone GrpE
MMMQQPPPDVPDPNRPSSEAPAEGPGGPGGPSKEPASGAGSGEGGDPERTVHDVIAALQAEVADFKDRWLRAQAETENVRKRYEREKEETAKYAISKFARDVVNVGDNFQRAIDAVPVGAAEREPALKSFLEGVTLTERELLNVLERYGIKRLNPKDEPFNPHLHQAMMEVPRSDVAPGTIVQVFQAGFTIEDRVLRPAMVVVAKAEPKPQPPRPAANDDEPPAPNGGNS